MTETIGKPLPRPTADTQTFWDSCAKGQLVYQSCQKCGRAQFPPRSHCAVCGSDRIVWKKSTGRGKIHSFTVVHRPTTPAFKADVPYVIALVDLDEQFRMMMNVRDTHPHKVTIGQRIEVFFEPVDDGIFLPQARPAR